MSSERNYAVIYMGSTDHWGLRARRLLERFGVEYTGVVKPGESLLNIIDDKGSALYSPDRLSHKNAQWCARTRQDLLRRLGQAA